jgi:hypothetical protein
VGSGLRLKVRLLSWKRKNARLTSGRNSVKTTTKPENVIWSQIGILHELVPAIVDVP